MAYHELRQDTAAAAGQGCCSEPADPAAETGLAAVEAQPQTSPSSAAKEIQQDGA